MLNSRPRECQLGKERGVKYNLLKFVDLQPNETQYR